MMGNIVTGSFKQTWLGTKDRANAIELTFNNAAKDYERDTMTCYGDNYDEPGIIPKLRRYRSMELPAGISVP